MTELIILTANHVPAGKTLGAISVVSISAVIIWVSLLVAMCYLSCKPEFWQVVTRMIELLNWVEVSAHPMKGTSFRADLGEPSSGLNSHPTPEAQPPAILIGPLLRTANSACVSWPIGRDTLLHYPSSSVTRVDFDSANGTRQGAG